jgi:hypothetical protein
MRLPGNEYFHFAVENMNESIKRSRMLAQSLSLVEGEDGDRTGIFAGNFPADNRVILIAYGISQTEFLRRDYFLLCLLLSGRHCSSSFPDDYGYKYSSGQIINVMRMQFYIGIKMFQLFLSLNYR